MTTNSNLLNQTEVEIGVALKLQFLIQPFKLLSTSIIFLDKKLNTTQILILNTRLDTAYLHKRLFSSKFSLKMGPIALFTHLKMILLQCFQFSAK